MNTVLDDTMTLCLANGERIKLREEIKLICEVEDLKVASPATVSRCGIIYVSENVVGISPIIERFFEVEVKPIFMKVNKMQFYESLFR